MSSRRNLVLIIDDDSRNTFALSAVLKSRGYECIIGADIHEALNLLREHHDVGIILMDMMMPEMDGYQAIPLLKGEPSFKHIPVIAVTAQAMAGDREKCLAAGADDYISKPVNIDMLQDLLNRYMNEK
jgi:CheY-like chemotaxis protein